MYNIIQIMHTVTTSTRSLNPIVMHTLFYINRIFKANFPLHLICSFLIEIKLPARDAQGDNVETSSNEAVECIVLEALSDISYKIIPAIVVFLQWQVFEECRGLAVEEHAHHQKLYQAPNTDQQQAQRKLVATERHFQSTPLLTAFKLQ